MKTLITLTNDFHGTQTRVVAGPISDATQRRVWRALCGAKGCTCGNEIGMRGPQDAELSHYSNATVLA